MADVYYFCKKNTLNTNEVSENTIKIEDAIYNRTERLLGRKLVDALHGCRVIVFGVGGVGSWCAEGLVRSGVTNITIVDSDTVCVTNVNRQLMATSENIGEPKVELLKRRLLVINPQANVTAINGVYNEQTSASFALETYDYVIDCIDSLKDKASLMVNATRSGAKVFSSMGAALKLDPTKVSVTEFWKVKGCPLARALRKKFKASGVYPRGKVMCVYSDELLVNKGCSLDCEQCPTRCPKADAEGGGTGFVKGQVNGSLVHITAIFGFHLSGLVIMDLTNKTK
ncbi:MAG: ThiF family adenylyltransferase [Muribaculaceae bacterium]